MVKKIYAIASLIIGIMISPKPVENQQRILFSLIFPQSRIEVQYCCLWGDEVDQPEFILGIISLSTKFTKKSWRYADWVWVICQFIPNIIFLIIFSLSLNSLFIICQVDFQILFKLEIFLTKQFCFAYDLI